MTYGEYLKHIEHIERKVEETGERLKSIAIPDIKGGITPDRIKSTDEYQQAKNDYNGAFETLRRFNSRIPIEFKKKRVEEARQLKIKQTKERTRK